ncbi:dockerin type I domain-containing protein, partial [Ruminococcus albus]
TFTISSAAAKSISGCTITLSQTSYTYDGTAKKPTVTVKDGSKTLTSGTDYTVSYSNNTNAGTATVTITGKGSYTGTVSKSFTISAKNASSLTATVSPTSYTYDGKAKTPAVTVTDGSKTLVNGTDYTVSYSANTEVGTAKANITFMGNYTGTKTLSFTISKAAPTSITKCTVTLGTTNYTYDGTAKKPVVNVLNGSDALTEGTDFTVAYSSNTNAGTATVTIKGIGNFTDSTTKTFTISPKNASALTVTVSPTSYTYDGKEKKPTVTVKDGTKTLTSGTDYTVSYSNNINAGTASAVITCKGNYTGTKSASFTISEPAAVSISGCTATLSASTYTYDGSEKKPSVTVKNGSTSLINGVDYIVSYTNNINAGTAAVNIMGLGRYTGTLTKTFTISQKSVSGLTVVVSPASYIYDGKAKQPDVTVTDGSRTLTNGKDYTLAYSNNVNAGTASIAVKGTGNYTGSLSKNFKITAKSVSELNVTLSATAFTYDGTAKKPSVTVSYGSKNLVSGTDFTVSYSNNTNIGTATVTVTGKGNYTGTKKANFTINKAEAVNIANCKATLSADSFVYDGMVKKPVPTVKRGDKTLRNGVDYTYDYENNINAGTASVIVTGIGEYAGTGTLHFTISPAPLDNIKIAVLTNNYIYDGTEKKPAVTVTEGMNTLVEGADYRLTYGNNVEAGTARVYVNGTGNYTGMKSATFTITAKAADSNKISDCSIQLSKKSYEYTGSAITPSVIVKDGTEVLTNNVDYSVDYIANVNAGTAKVVVTGMGKYIGIYEDSFTITAKSAKSLGVTVSPESYDYNGTARKPKVTVKDGSRVLTEKTDYTLDYSDNIIAGNAVVTVNFTGNYSGTLNKSFKIKPSDITKASIKLENYCYDAVGSARCPSVTIEMGGRTLVENRDYLVSYSNNTSAGIAYVSISGLGNYYGSVTQPFVIDSASAKSISGCTISMDTKTFAYDGTAKKPQITLKNGSVTLKEHQDFEVAYYNNINAGKATAIVIGRGGYKGTLTASFTITPKSLAGAQAALSAASFNYDGNAKTPVVTVTADGTELTEGRDFTVAYKNNTAAGTASAVITGTGNYSGSTEKKFTINSKNAACLNVVLEKNEYAYTGKAITPKVKVYDGSILLTEGTHYSVTYVNNIAVGAAKAVVTCKGNYTGKISRGFAITGKSTSKIKKGDVTGDGVINLTDLTKVAAHVKGRKLLSGDQLKAADVNGDGKVNITDISLMAAHIKGKKLIK